MCEAWREKSQSILLVFLRRTWDDWWEVAPTLEHDQISARSHFRSITQTLSIQSEPDVVLDTSGEEASGARFRICFVPMGGSLSRLERESLGGGAPCI